MIPSGMMLPMQIIPEKTMPVSTIMDKSLMNNRIQELDDELNSVISDVDSTPESVFSGSSNIKNVSISGTTGKKRGRKPKINITDENTITI